MTLPFQKLTPYSKEQYRQRTDYS
nr:unnamed protein product [Callosobruchus analis]